MILRCVIDGLLLPAEIRNATPPLLAYDGAEAFFVEALEARYYEIVEATHKELLHLEQRQYRFLRFADDYQRVSDSNEDDPPLMEQVFCAHRS